MGDIKMAEMSAHANAVQSATLDTIATAADVAIANVSATKTAAETAITATKTAAETSVTQTKNAALAVMAQTETSTVATVNAAAQTAIQQAASSRDQAIAATHLQQAIADFIPPQHTDTIQLMELLAVQESSRRSLLPERFAKLAPTEVSELIGELKRRVR